MSYELKTLIFALIIILLGCMAVMHIQGKITTLSREIACYKNKIQELNQDINQKEQLFTRLNSKTRIVKIAKDKLGLIEPKNDPNLICFVELSTNKSTEKINNIRLLDFFTSTVYANELK